MRFCSFCLTLSSGLHRKDKSQAIRRARSKADWGLVIHPEILTPFEWTHQGRKVPSEDPRGKKDVRLLPIPQFPQPGFLGTYENPVFWVYMTNLGQKSPARRQGINSRNSINPESYWQVHAQHCCRRMNGS